MRTLARLLDPVPFAAVLLLVFVLPVTVYPPAHRYVIGEDVAASVVVSLALLAVLTRWIITGRQGFEAAGVYVPLAAFIVLVTASLLRCRYCLMCGLEDGCRWYLLAAAFFLTFNYCRQGRRPVWIVAAWALSVVPAVLQEWTQSRHGITEVLQNWHNLWIGRRIGTTLGNVNIFGGYTASLTVLVVPLVLYFVWRRRLLPAAAAFVLFLLSAAGAWLSYSMGARVGVLCGAAYLFAAWLSVRTRRTAAVVFCIALVVAAALLAVPRIRGPVVESVRYGTFAPRLFIYGGTARMTAARPLLGSGPGSFPMEYPFFRDPECFRYPFGAPVAWHTHSHVLEAAAENGLPAAAALCILYGWCLLSALAGRGPEYARLWDLSRVSRIAAGGACCALLGHGMGSMMLDGPLVPVWYLWIGLAIAYGGPSSRRDVAFGGAVSAAACAVTAVITVGSVLPVNYAISEAHAKAAKSYQIKSAWETAVYHYDRALEVRPYALVRLTSRAVCLQNLGRHREALDTFATILRYAPLYGRTQYLMARSYRAMGRRDRARQALSRWVAADPYDRKGCVMLVEVCLESGRLDEARAMMQKALQIWPEDSLVLACAGRVYMFSGDRQEGLSFFRRAVHLDDRDPRLKLNLSLALLANGYTDEAEHLIGEIVSESDLSPTDRILHQIYLDLHPGIGEDFNSLLAQGIEEGRAGRFEQARKKLYLAVLLHPQDADALRSLGTCCYEHGMSVGLYEEVKRRDLFRQAATFFQLACEAAPNDVSIKEALAYSLFHAGDPAGSLRVWIEIGDMDPENPYAGKNIGKLRRILSSAEKRTSPLEETRSFT